MRARVRFPAWRARRTHATHMHIRRTYHAHAMRMPCMHCAHLGECDVLAHLQLDQVLLAVDDLHVAFGRDLADVARAEVADAIDGDEVLLVLGDDVRVGVLRVDQVAVAHLVRVRIRVKG